MQRPLQHFDRRLECRPFWEAESLPAARALEAAFPEILAELMRILPEAQRRFVRYESRVISSGGWSDVQLYSGCK